MVGEIRDLKTAEIAIKLANTGHLTFSTLHTNDAVSVVSRLFKMGVEPFLIANAVNIVVAQRLVRALCPACKQPAGEARPAPPGEAGRARRGLRRTHRVPPRRLPRVSPGLQGPRGDSRSALLFAGNPRAHRGGRREHPRGGHRGTRPRPRHAHPAGERTRTNPDRRDRAARRSWPPPCRTDADGRAGAGPAPEDPRRVSRNQISREACDGPGRMRIPGESGRERAPWLNG